MVEVKVDRDYAFGAEEVWAVFADFGNVGWVPGIEKVELEGKGVGMIRHLTVPVYPRLHERLEVLDHGERVLEYSIPEVEYIGVKNYRARAQVIDLGDGRCRVRMSCRAEANGGPEAEVRSKTRDFYAAMLGWVDDFLMQSARAPIGQVRAPAQGRR
ncbi:MAG: SRPBCC family protein [Myxococcota bacterium]